MDFYKANKKDSETKGKSQNKTCDCFYLWEQRLNPLLKAHSIPENFLVFPRNSKNYYLINNFDKYALRENIQIRSFFWSVFTP